HQISLPMARDGPIRRLRRSIMNRDCVRNFAASALSAGETRMTHLPLSPQMVLQLLLQNAAGLHKQAAIDCLVRHAHRLVIGISDFKPAAHLFWRPVAVKFAFDGVARSPVLFQETSLGA